jgi:cell wall assembly regulator SMI1
MSPTPLELVRRARDAALTTKDGRPVPLELEPGLTYAEISDFEKRLPSRIPAGVRELLAYTSGFTGGATRIVDLTGRGCDFEFYAAFPHGHPIAADGFGNFWVVDLLPESTEWGPIFFVCHDPPVILYQSATVGDFLDELFKTSVAPHKSLLDDVHADRLFKVWQTNPGVLSFEQASVSSDPDIRAFSESLGPAYQLIDMRQAPIGFGFSWGRYGPQTVVRRHGTHRIFAYEQRKRSFLGRLFQL